MKRKLLITGLTLTALVVGLAASGSAWAKSSDCGCWDDFDKAFSDQEAYSDIDQRAKTKARAADPAFAETTQKADSDIFQDADVTASSDGYDKAFANQKAFSDIEQDAYTHAYGDATATTNQYADSTISQNADVTA